MASWGELGRTRLYTRRERRRRLAVILLCMFGVVLAAWIAAGLVSWLSAGALSWPLVHLRPVQTGAGDGGLLGLSHASQPTEGVSPPRRWQMPVTLTWPVSAGWTAMVAVPLWFCWLRLTVWPLLAGLRRPARQRGLASLRAIRAELGARRVRRRGRYTLPTTPRWTRRMLPTRAFGYRLGRPLHERGRWLWADWEQRIRIVARTGWGKTDRLLVPIIRALPGPALVASIEPGIFDKTVTARQFRRPAARWWCLTLLARPWLRLMEYPVAVVDFSAPDRRFAAGYPAVRWSPIVGCADHAVAYRRALALVTGADRSAQQPNTGGENSQFFRDSASEVLAAWLHAADLAALDVDDLLGWLRQPDDPTATRILRDNRRAEPSAAVNLGRHLDPAAARTTSGVLRYLTLALNSLATAEGRALCGRRRDDQFDMPAHIAAGGTVYLLADTGRIERARPLLSLFAAELFMAAETVALTSFRRRLPQPFIGVIDEMRYGITVPNLPYVASAQRKYNIGYVYGVQTASQEDTVYGPDAAALRAAAGVSIIGGIDVDSARELSERAGPTPVVTSTRGADLHNEYIQVQDTLTIADQQRLADGQAVVIARGLAPFLTWMPSYRDSRSLARRIDREADTVTRRVASTQQRHRSADINYTAATAAGADFPPPGDES